MALEGRFGLERLLLLAGEKDRGFLPSVFAEMVGRFSRLGRAEFPLDDEQYEKLARVINTWRTRALEVARDQERGFDIAQDREPDLGLGL